MVDVRAWLMLAACSAWATACAPPCVDDGLHAKQHGPACVASTTTTATTTTSSTDDTTEPVTSGTSDASATTTPDPSTSSTTSSTTTSTTTSTTDTTSTSTSSSDTGSGTDGDHCLDDLLDADETDVDCGGSCAPCPNDFKCADDADCVSKACHFNGVCVPPSCDNGKFDPGEGHVDCGAVCGKTCSLGAPCGSDDDCFAGTCIAGKKCALDPDCVSGEHEASETDYDCGGVCGPTCEFGDMCLIDGDCISGSCVDLLCENQARCMNKVQDGGETDIDCGGPCKGCQGGEACIVKTDCEMPIECFGMACD